MANVSIPNLPPAIALSGAEQIEVVQGGVSCRATLGQLVAPVGGVFATYPALAATTGAALVGTTDGTTVQAALDARVRSSDLAASSGATLVGYTAAFTGAVLRTAASKFGDIASVRDFGAVGDGAASDTAAVSSWDNLASKKYIPAGNYKTTTASASFKGPWRGDGQVIDSSSNKRAPWFTAVSSAPSSFGNWTSLETAFNGDISKVLLPIEARITGAATLGRPTTGYVYTPEAYPIIAYLYNSSGWNQQTGGNDGRTAACLIRGKVDQYGQGDAVVFNASAFVTGARAGATSFLANPAASLFNGDMTAGASGVYMNPFETNCVDGGFDVAHIGAVYNGTRTVNTGAIGAWWGGVRVQSNGAAAWDNIISAIGKFNAGLDFTGSALDFGTNKGAATLKANDRVYLNASSSNGNFVTSYGGEYITYSSGISGIICAVGGSAILQLTASQVTSTVTTVATNIRVNAATSAASAGQLAFGTTTATSATAGANGAPPAQVLGYLVANLGGTTIKLPYYSN